MRIRRLPDYMFQIKLCDYHVCFAMFDFLYLADAPPFDMLLTMFLLPAYYLVFADSYRLIEVLLARNLVVIFDHRGDVADKEQLSSNFLVRMMPVDVQFPPHLLLPTHTHRVFIYLSFISMALSRSIVLIPIFSI